MLMFAETSLLSCWFVDLVFVIQIGKSADAVQDEGIYWLFMEFWKITLSTRLGDTVFHCIDFGFYDGSEIGHMQICDQNQIIDDFYTNAQIQLTV